MTMPDELLYGAGIYVAVILIVALYALFVARTRKATQGARLRFGEVGQQLVDSHSLPLQAERSLKFLLDNAFNEWFPWKVIPGVFVVFVRTIFGRKLDVVNFENKEQADKYYYAVGLYVISMMGLSPAATSIMIGLIFIFLVPTNGMRRVFGLLEVFTNNTFTHRHILNH